MTYYNICYMIVLIQNVLYLNVYIVLANKILRVMNCVNQLYIWGNL